MYPPIPSQSHVVHIAIFPQGSSPMLWELFLIHSKRETGERLKVPCVTRDCLVIPYSRLFYTLRVMIGIGFLLTKTFTRFQTAFLRFSFRDNQCCVRRQEMKRPNSQRELSRNYCSLLKESRQVKAKRLSKMSRSRSRAISSTLHHSSKTWGETVPPLDP